MQLSSLKVLSNYSTHGVFNDTQLAFGDFADGLWVFTAYQVLAILFFVLGCPAIFVIIYLVKKVARLKTPTNYLLCSLAVADFLVLLWMLITVLEISFGWLSQEKAVLGYVYPSVDMFLASASLVNVCLVSCDRAIACVFPLRYYRIMNDQSKYILSAAWSYCIIILALALTRIFWKNEEFGLFVFWLCVSLSVFVPVILVIISYTVIAVTAFRGLNQQKEKCANQYIEELRLECSEESLARKSSKRSSVFSLQFRTELKLTGMILINVVPFTLGWTFYVGVQLYEFVIGEYIHDPIFNIIFTATPWLISSVNANLYFVTNKAIRHAFFDQIKKCRFQYEHRKEYNKTNNGRLRQSMDNLKRLSIFENSF